MLALARRKNVAHRASKTSTAVIRDVGTGKTLAPPVCSVQRGRKVRSPRIRLEKVLHVQAQIAEGEYEFQRRLDVAFIRLLEDLER
jgi:anti-sigma28 factor (negative regulator of flagellin synthesis)